MKNYLLVLLTLSTLVLVSCKEDEEPTPPHIVGKWNLENFATINLPDAFASNEGSTYEVNEITFGGIAFDSYDLTFSKDGSFSRDISIQGRLPQTDDGNWEIDEDELILTDEDDNEEFYDIIKNENDELWFSLSASFSLIPDSTYVRLFEEYETNQGVIDYLNSLTDEEFGALFYAAPLDLVYVLSRDDN